MTPERITHIERLAQTYGAKNCWTGTTGVLAEAIVDLLKERALLIERIALLREELAAARQSRPWIDTTNQGDDW